MSKSTPKSVLVDTTFLIHVFNPAAEFHAVADKYYRYFCRHNITMRLSTVVISEFHQKQSIMDVLGTNNFIPLPYNIDHAITTADICYRLGGMDKRGEGVSRDAFKDDLKLMAQAEKESITYIITADDSTLGKYCENLSKSGLYKPIVIKLSAGFDTSLFNGGQGALIDEE